MHTKIVKSKVVSHYSSRFFVLISCTFFYVSPYSAQEHTREEVVC